MSDVGEAENQVGGFCKHCGGQVIHGEIFCMFCGISLVAPESGVQEWRAGLLKQDQPRSGGPPNKLTVAGLVVCISAGPLSALSWLLPYASGGERAISDDDVGFGRFLAYIATEMVFSIFAAVVLLSHGPRRSALLSAVRGGASWLLVLGVPGLMFLIPPFEGAGIGFWVTLFAYIAMLIGGLLIQAGAWRSPLPARPIFALVALVLSILEGELLKGTDMDVASLHNTLYVHGSTIGLGLGGLLLLATRTDGVTQFLTWAGWIFFGIISVWASGLASDRDYLTLKDLFINSIGLVLVSILAAVILVLDPHGRKELSASLQPY